MIFKIQLELDKSTKILFARSWLVLSEMDCSMGF